MSIELVQIIEGIGIIPVVENGGDDPDLSIGFGYCYTDGPNPCEYQDEGNCTEDGIVWMADDMNAPCFCHQHYFPQEQLGYEFIELKEE